MLSEPLELIFWNFAVYALSSTRILQNGILMIVDNSIDIHILSTQQELHRYLLDSPYFAEISPECPQSLDPYFQGKKSYPLKKPNMHAAMDFQIFQERDT